MQKLFKVTLGVDYAARDTGRRITMCVRETDSLSAAIRAESLADKRLARPAVEYTHAISVTPVVRSTAAAPAMAMAA
ncbi:MAG: hypothetical protein O3C10_08450 [Chloroflexi bacterium]|nr:hypothetical protein [Chloroflexota bacterium]